MAEKCIVTINFSKCYSVEFVALKTTNTQDKIAYVRLNELDIIDSDRGTVAIQPELKKLVFYYDSFTVISDIFSCKETPEYIKYRCSTDKDFFDVKITYGPKEI